MPNSQGGWQTSLMSVLDIWCLFLTAVGNRHRAYRHTFWRQINLGWKKKHWKSMDKRWFKFIIHILPLQLILHGTNSLFFYIKFYYFQDFSDIHFTLIYYHNLYNKFSEVLIYYNILSNMKLRIKLFYMI